MHPLDDEILEIDGVFVFYLGRSYGSLPEDSLQRLGERLLACVHENPHPRMVLDFSRTEYINSSFIEAVFRAWKRAKEKGGQMAFCCLNPFCGEVLRVTKLDRVWAIFPTREEALAAVRQG